MAINFLNTVAVDDSVLFVDTINDRVGIGTDSPNSLLEISKQLSAAGTIDYPYTISSRDDNNSINQVGGEGVGIKFRIAGNDNTAPGNSLVGASIAAIRENASDSDSSTGLGFFITQNDETLDEAVRINHDGNVGIGTSSPYDSSWGVNSKQLTISGTDYGVLNLIDAGGPTKFAIGAGDGKLYLAYDDVASEHRIVVDSVGNVGIGTTSPGEKLEVDGSILATVANNGTIKAQYNSDNTIQIQANSSGGVLGANASGTTKILLRSYGDSYINGGNVGIGTTSPETKLSVVGETSTNSLIGGSINLATSYGWTIPSGTFTQRVGYYGGDFTPNGMSAENSMEWGLGPFKDRQLLWTTIGSTDNNSDGGWNKTLTNLDIDSSYLSVVYFKRTSSETSGSFYHGTGKGTNQITNLNGTANTNPYFIVRSLGGFDQNVWYASVGVIQSNSDSNTTYTDISGLYRLDTGAKISNGNTFKFGTAGATLTSGHRTYLYYSTDVDVVVQFANPGFYKIDGNQPKLHDILGDNDDAFWSADGDDIYNDNSGNVGIGTTSPGEKLTVVGNLLLNNTGEGWIKGYDNYHSIKFRAGGTNKTEYYEYGGTLANGLGHKFFTGGTTGQTLKLQIADDGSYFSGNVGIGTTSPVAKLHIQDTSGANIILNSATGAVKNGIYMTEATTSTPKQGGAYMYYDGSSNKFNIATGAGVPTDKLTILRDSGNVGIGMTGPSSKLHVLGNVIFDGHNIGDPDSTSRAAYPAAQMFTHYDEANGVSIIGGEGGFNGTGLTIGEETDRSSGFKFIRGVSDTNGGANAAEEFWVNGVGSAYFASNVGIGTTTPSSKLEVNGDIDTTGSSGYLINGMAWALENSGVLTLGDWDGNDFPTRIMDNNSSEVLRVTGGNVGIGTTTPGVKLEVAGRIQASSEGFQIDTGGYGDIRIRPYYSAFLLSNTLYVGGTSGYSYKAVYAASFNVNSDYRLKTNVVDLEEAIERIKQINVHRFNWKDRLDEEKVDGFLAHELAEVIPEAVTGEKDAVREDGTLDYQGVDQSKVVPLLTAALQEAISKIEQLEIRIQTLENN